MYISNGSVGHWVDTFMADAVNPAPIRTAPQTLPPRSEGGGEARSPGAFDWVFILMFHIIAKQIPTVFYFNMKLKLEGPT